MIPDRKHSSSRERSSSISILIQAAAINTAILTFTEAMPLIYTILYISYPPPAS